MPDLFTHLVRHDLGFLRIVAEQWGLPLEAADAEQAAEHLAAALVKAFPTLWERLEPEARQALQHLRAQGGRLPWAAFERRYGPLRAMGPARRDRERPDRQPVSLTERLWYLGLVGRAFFQTPSGPEEFAYLPREFLALVPDLEVRAEPLGHPARPEETAHLLPRPPLLAALTSCLAAYRLGRDETLLFPEERAPFPEGALTDLARAAGLLDEADQPRPPVVRDFLAAPPGEALRRLFHAWRTSPTLDELDWLPHLQREGAWQRDPRPPRERVLAWLQRLPAASWWSLEAFIAAVRQQEPDFARPTPGDFDSWYLRHAEEGHFLRGLAHWDVVDGALLRLLLTGPLHWFGVVDLAAETPGGPPRAFRLGGWAAALLADRAPEGLPEEAGRLRLRPDALVLVPFDAPRLVRYQVARAAHWEGLTAQGYTYRLTPESLAQARQQGLRVGHLLALFRRHAGHVPPSLTRALTRWEEFGAEAHLETLTVLRVRDAAILDALRRTPARRFLGRPLGPTAVVVPRRAVPALRRALAELGYLAAVAVEEEEEGTTPAALRG